MQTNPAAEQNKNSKWSENPYQSGDVRKEKVCGGYDLPKSQVLSSEWKTKRVIDDTSSDSEDDEDDDDVCVIEPELLPAEVCGNRDFRSFCSCDLDPYSVTMYRRTRNEFSTSRLLKVIDRITDRPVTRRHRVVKFYWTVFCMRPP